MRGYGIDVNDDAVLRTIQGGNNSEYIGCAMAALFHRWTIVRNSVYYHADQDR